MGMLGALGTFIISTRRIHSSKTVVKTRIALTPEGGRANQRLGLNCPKPPNLQSILKNISLTLLIVLRIRTFRIFKLKYVGLKK